VARAGGLPAAFWLLAALMGLVTLSARIVAPDPRQAPQPFSSSRSD